MLGHAADQRHKARSSQALVRAHQCLTAGFTGTGNKVRSIFVGGHVPTVSIVVPFFG